MASLFGFAWSKAASMCVGVSAFDSTGIYPFNRNRLLEYFFPISYTNENVTCMEIAHPNMPPGFVPSTSVTNAQNVLPILAEGSLSTLSAIISPEISPEEITASRPLNITSIVPEIQRKYLNKKKHLPFFSLKKLVTSRKSKRSKEEINSNKGKYRKCKQSQYTRSENADKEIKTFIHIQEASDDSDTKCVSAEKTICRRLRKMTGSDL